ncbi:Protein FAM98A [Nymphon striatum]|nr:Protein FAM98A [Nymphon striatum]
MEQIVIQLGQQTVHGRREVNKPPRSLKMIGFRGDITEHANVEITIYNRKTTFLQFGYQNDMDISRKFGNFSTPSSIVPSSSYQSTVDAALACVSVYSENDVDGYNKIKSGSTSNQQYINIICWLSSEIVKSGDKANKLSSICDVENEQDFIMELRSFLEEINSPKSLLADQYLKQIDSLYLDRVLFFLCTELQATRMNAIIAKKNKDNQSNQPQNNSAHHMKSMMMTLGISKPPPQVTSVQLFTKLESKIKELMSKISPAAMGKPLFTDILTDKQWQTLQDINYSFNYEYTHRRQMLLKRLDVTIRSFTWSDQIKKMEDDIARAFNSKRQKLTDEPNITIADLLAAREELIHLNKTSSAVERKNTKCAINKFIIGSVPDRGGRPSEQRAPPPEMPSWQARKDGGGGGGRGGGGGNYGNRGGRVQGNWSRGRGDGDRGGQHGRGGDRGGQHGRGGDRGGQYGRGGDRGGQYGRGGGRGGYSRGDYQGYR